MTDLSGSVTRCMGFRAFARSQPTIVALVLAVALVTLDCGFPAPAGAYLYWVSNGVIDRADLNGKGVEENFVPRPPAYNGVDSIAISNQHIYLGGAGTQGLIGRAGLNGGAADPDLLRIPQPSPETPSRTLEVNAQSLAVNSDHLYWTSGTGEVGEEHIGDSVGRADLAGGGVEPNFIQTTSPVHAVAVDAHHIYWATEQAIGRADLAGGDVEPDFIQLRPIVNIHGVASASPGVDVAEGHIYWTEEHAIARADLGGHHINRRFITLPGVYLTEVAVGGGYVFWDAGKPLGGQQLPSAQWNPKWQESIGRASLNGTDVQESLINFSGPLTRLDVNTLGPGASHPTKRDKQKHR